MRSPSSASHPVTRATPARRAASATDVPINPVPTTASALTIPAIYAGGRGTDQIERISSATRKAKSRDWRAFSRGSHSVR